MLGSFLSDLGFSRREIFGFTFLREGVCLFSFPANFNFSRGRVYWGGKGGGGYGRRIFDF